MGSKSSSPIGGYYPTSQNTSYNSSGTSSGTTTQTANPLAAFAYQQALQNAQGIAATPFEPYQGQLVAGMTPLQIAAQQGFKNAVGSSSPYYTAAQSLYNQVPGYLSNSQLGNASKYYSQAIGSANNPTMGTAQNLYNTSLNYLDNPMLPTAQRMYNTAIDYSNPENYNQGTLSRYMNPYQQAVVDATMAQLIQTEKEALGARDQQSVLRGSYGGSGQFLGRSQVAKQQALQNAQTLAALNAQNYQNAQQQYNQQQATAIQAQQQAASVLGQLGYQQQTAALQALQNAAQGIGSLGYQNAALQTQAYLNAAQGLGSLGAQQQQNALSGILGAASGMGNIGTQQQQSYLQGLTALNAAGAQQQALEQAQLDKAYQQWQQAKAYPYQQTSFFSGLASGLGPLLGSNVSTTGTSSQSGTGAQLGMQPYANQSGAGGIAGAVTSGLGILGSLFGLKDGGRVTGRKHYAEGGTDEESEEQEPQDFGSLIRDSSPYSSTGAGTTAKANSGYMSSLGQNPYASGRGDYITDSLKLSKVIPSARQVESERLAQEISKVLSAMPNRPTIPNVSHEITSSFFGSPDTSGMQIENPFSGSSESSASSSSGEKRGGLLSSLFDGSSSEDTSGSSGGFDIGSILGNNGESLFASGGRAQLADGGSPEPTMPRTIGELMKTPESQAFNKQMNPTGNTGLGFDALLAQAYANSPGPQRTPEEQGMPAMPKSSYYTKPLSNYMQMNPPVPYPMAGGSGGGSGGSGGGSGGGFGGTSPNIQTQGLATSMYGAKDEDFVNALYKNYLNRAPDEGGLKFYMDKLKSGESKSSIEGGFAGSAEAQTDQFVDNLYKKILGRSPDPGGVEYWMNVLSSGVSPENVENQFLASPEREESSVVQGYYPKIASTSINPYTGLFNLDYVAPYKSQPVPYGYSDGGAVGRATGGRLSLGDIAKAALQAGATPKEAAVLTSIAMPESGRNPYAHNPNVRTGDNSYGLWQINMLGGMGPERRRQFGLSSNEQLYDPVTNARAALQILRGPGGLKNWTTYTKGKNRPYYSAAVEAVNSLSNDPRAMLTKIEAPAPLDIHTGGEPNRASVMYGPPPASGVASAVSQAPEAKPRATLADLLSSISAQPEQPQQLAKAPEAPEMEELPMVQMEPVIPIMGSLGSLGEGSRGRYLDELIARNSERERVS